MATSANPPQGAIPTNPDPFTVYTPTTSLRYATFDTDQFSLYSSNSPSQAKRALEAHLKDTDRRIQDASRLGTTLVHQRKELSARLKDIEQVQADDEVPEELQKKLSELEREYNEVGKESARAFLPKSRMASEGSTPTVFTSNGRESPTKMTAPSRRQRNQPTNRIHDIEFATEISTSLLAQVRQLQAALQEKDEALKDTNSVKAHVEADAYHMSQRIKHLGDNEQRYKDENWNMELKLQELESGMKTTVQKHDRATQALALTQSEKTATQRELDDLKVTYEKLSEDHASVKRQQETDVHGLRRDILSHHTERQTMQKRIEELTAQNTELARAMSSRWNQQSAASESEFVSADEERADANYSPEQSEPASPVKGTPRHGMLESETLKSSLNHAHRMIQNLKNNIHREKTEKIELKRMLQDARDEIESRRSESSGVGANIAKKRDSTKSRKPVKLDRLGAARSSTTEIIQDEPDWEDHDGPTTPSKSSFAPKAAALGTELPEHDTESTDAFLTANERDGLTTENEAFETGQEDMANDSDDLTETEGSIYKSNVRSRVVSAVSNKPGDRRSFMSTASTSADEDDEIRTPVHSQQPKYRLRMSRNNGSRRNVRAGEIMSDSPITHSPSSSMGTPQPAGQSLGDELDALDESSVEGTPGRRSEEFAHTRETQRHTSVGPDTPTRALTDPIDLVDDVEHDEEVHDATIVGPAASVRSVWPASEEDHQAEAVAIAPEAVAKQPEMVSTGMMTEPWKPEKEIVHEKQSITARAGEVVGGALAGFGLGRFGGRGTAEDEGEAEPGADAEDAPASGEANGEAATEPSAMVVQRNVASDTTAASIPVHEAADVGQRPSIAVKEAELPEAQVMALQHSPIITQETAPIAPLPVFDVVKVVESAVPVTEIPAPAARSQLEPEPEHFEFSTVQSQHFEPSPLPSVSSVPLVPKRSSRRIDLAYASDEIPWEEAQDTDKGLIPATDDVRPGANFFAAVPPEPEARPTDVESTASTKDQSDATPDGPLPILAPLKIKKPVADSGAQTTVSSDDIESMLRNKARVFSGVDASNSPMKQSHRRSIDGVVLTSASDPLLARNPRRPSSAGSIRAKGGANTPPPLPENHMLQIAAAHKTPAGPATVGAMGPPTMPASAYKANRPRTPAERVTERSMSRDGTTPRPPRARDSRGQMPSSPIISRRPSVSSFASELDERFNMTRGQLMLPNDIEPSTDPRMIQAITQTMIGEYLWKYVRKAGRSETSNTRHRRFFWVHPYTRTLYWSEQDPSSSGPNMVKAKSMAIQAVRVITDDNPLPPGLHRKTLVVVTPGREIMMTAQTGQRHETWFNALSYLLLRTEQEKAEAEDTINQEDLDEFNPGFSVRRSISRFATGRDRSVNSQSRRSMSSYNSRTTRTSSPRRAANPQQPTLTQPRQNSAPTRPPPAPPGAAAAATSDSRPSSAREGASGGGVFSSITSRFRTGGSTSHHARRSFSSLHRKSNSSLRGPEGIYDASIAADSAGDLRAVIERQERDADRLENVRACCDGKHDVGSLARTGRHGGGDGHSHSHTHASFGSRLAGSHSRR